MTKQISIIVLILSTILPCFSQAGYGVYQFLELPASSRLAALGGSNVSLKDNDINFAFQNPALLGAESNKVISFNTAFYLADIQFGSVAYAKSIDSTSTLAIGIQYIDFGTFKNVTDFNEIIGQFTAKDYAVSAMYARQLNKLFSIGVSLKPIYSVYEQYSSFGFGVDAGISYYNPKELISVGFVFRNFGSQIKGYYSDENGQHLEPLPLNIQLGATKKFAHAPLRLSLTLHNLQQFDLSYKSTNQPKSSLTATTTANNDSFVKTVGNTFEKAVDHAIVGVEFVPNNNFYVAVSYNRRRQAELSSDGFKSYSGFSFGAGIKLSKYHVGFGRSQFYTGNYAYQFSLSTALNEFKL